VCEIARNSVLQSGFEDIVKKYWIGDNYKSKEPNGNSKDFVIERNIYMIIDFDKTNVPHTRYLYRLDTLKSEIMDLETLEKYSQKI